VIRTIAVTECERAQRGEHARFEWRRLPQNASKAYEELSMLFRSAAGKKVALRTLDVMTVVAAAVVTVSCANQSSIRAQSRQSVAPPNVRLPDEAAGVDRVVRALISAFDQADIVALGEAHTRRADSDLRIALVRHLDFAKKVRSIVVEFASTTEQS